jgi:DNA topoisomerase-1
MQDTIIGIHPDSGKQIYLLQGPYGMYLQEGEKEKGKKLRRASLPKEKDPAALTLEDAVSLLALPRTLGKHPESGKEVTAAIGKYGPYVGCDGEFRSLKEGDDPYTVTLERALELLKEEKKGRSRQSAVKVLGPSPTTGKDITLYKMGSRYFVRKGIIPVYFPEGTEEDSIDLPLALAAIQAYKKK